MDEHEPAIDARLADLRRRRAEAVDVLSETLLDMYLKKRQADRAGRVWPPPEAPQPPAPKVLKERVAKPQPVRVRPPAMIRKYRDALEADLDVVAPLLAWHGFTREELVAPVNRLFVIQEHHEQFTAVGILDKHGPVGVLRALVVEPKDRRVTHGSYLAIHLLKRAHHERLLYVYALGIAPDFLNALGFTTVERATVPELVLSLPGLAGATLPVFEAQPRRDGAKRPNSRHYPKTLTQLLAAPERRNVR